MTADTCAHVTLDTAERVVRWWQRRLGLQLWELDLHLDDREGWREHEDRPGASDAFTWRPRDYETAELYLNPEWREWSPRKFESIVVHELLHLVTRDVELVLDLIDGDLHRDVDDVVTTAHRHAVEGAIDRLAYRLLDLVDELTGGSSHDRLTAGRL